jgi:hypothetical protein
MRNFVVIESPILEKFFDTTLPLWISRPVYQLDNKYFKGTILEAYNVYIKYDGIYIKLDISPEIYKSKEVKLFSFFCLLGCNIYYTTVLRVLDSFLNLDVSLNKYGEITILDQYKFKELQDKLYFTRSI